MTGSNPPENICVSVKTNNKWGCLRILAFSKDGQSCVWWIAPHGIRADLRKTVPASVFFQADCQEEKRLGGGVRENGGGDGRGARVGVEGAGRSKQGQLACFKPSR